MSDEVTDAQIVQKNIDADIQTAWDALMSNEAGRLILWSILDKCGCFAFPHYGTSEDALHRGRQQIGSELLNDYVFVNGMRGYTDMLLEAEAREKRVQDAIDNENQEDENP